MRSWGFRADPDVKLVIDLAFDSRREIMVGPLHGHQEGHFLTAERHIQVHHHLAEPVTAQ